MYIRKSLAVILAIALVFGSFSFAFAVENVETTSSSAATFTDLSGHWATDAIYKWAGHGIINGFEGKFRPNDSITRGEMAVILDNLMDYQVKATNQFTDLEEGKFYTDAVLKANAAGIMNGDGTTVRPNDKITREEAALMLSRAFAVKEATAGNVFTDSASISAWAKGAVFGMEAKAYISGYNGKFEPKANITRAAVVTMINNIVKAYYTAAGTYTENVNGTAIIKVSDVILKGVTISENLIIAEGVGQGDATLDSVTVKGDTVIRGGGANSIHIIETSHIANLTIEVVDGKVRVVADGSVIQEVEITEGEEIILDGDFGTVTNNVQGAKLVAVEGTLIAKVVANAETDLSGKGTVKKADFNAGANGSSITTPNTIITVATGVNGVTAGGGTAIPAGSTGTNNASGNGASVGTSAGAGGGGGGGGGHSDKSLSVSNVRVVNDHTITFKTAVAGATIKWNNVTLDIVTTTGDNTITVPLMVSGMANKLEVIKSGYTAFTDSNILFTEPYDTDATLGTWVQDRTDPKTWSEDDGWITLETKTEPNNNWYAWQGRKSATNIGLTNQWKFETQLELTESMINRDGIRASVWLQVEGCENFGEANQSGVIDWSILQFKKDSAADVAGWQYWNSSGAGSWNNLDDVATGSGIYTLTMVYNSGTMYQYINGNLVNSYDIDAREDVSAPTQIILQSYSFGESYTAKWRVPTVEYLYDLPADAKIITDVDDLNGAIDTQTAGENWIIMSGTYPVAEQLDIVTPLTIESYGSGPVIIQSDNASWSTTNGEKHLLGVYDRTDADPVSIKNIIFDANDQSYGVNTYDNAYCLLEDVTIRNSKGAGLTVNGSTVIAANLTTNSNGWGGVNVDPGSGVNTPSIFTLTGNGSFAEAIKIWSDGSHVTDTATVTVNASGYTWANPFLGVPGFDNFKQWDTQFVDDIARTFANITFVRMSESYVSAELSLRTSTLADLSGIQWELYDGEGEILAVNKAVRGDVDSAEELIWTDLDGSRTNISSPFRTTIEDDGYWEYGSWDGTAPAGAVLTLTYTGGATVIIDQSSFTGDKIKPVLQEAIRSGNTIELVYDKELHSGSLESDSFEVLVNDAEAEIDNAAIYPDVSNVVTIQVSDDSTILSNDTVQVNYTGVVVKDTFGNKAENFSMIEVECGIFEDQYEEEEYDETYGKDYWAVNITKDGTAQTHTIAPIQDTDVLYFEAVEGSTYTIKTSNLNSGLYSDMMDTVIWLTTTSGIINLDDCISNDDVSDGDLSSQIVWTADADYEACYIIVQHYSYDDEAGSYDISVTEEPAAGTLDMMQTLRSIENSDRGPIKFDIDVTNLPRLPKSN